MRKLKYLGLSLFLLLSVLAFWAFYVEPRSLTIRAEQILIPNWPTALDNTTVAILTDLHVGSPFNGTDKLESIVDSVNAIHPDFIFLLGDYVIQGVVGGKFIPPEDIAKTLGTLRAKHGVFAVLGNHDGWFDAKRIAQSLQKNHITVLQDSAVVIQPGVAKLYIAGLTDLWTGKADIKRTLAYTSDTIPTLLLTHSPDVFPDVPQSVTMTLAGHTHGGQVNLPLIGRPVVPSKFGRRYATGHIFENGKHMFVATGTGTSILPIRFRVPPEITVLHLSALQPPVNRRPSR